MLRIDAAVAVAVAIERQPEVATHVKVVVGTCHVAAPDQFVFVVVVAGAADAVASG